MKLANDPTVDYRQLVRDGYDRCSEAYTEARRCDPGSGLEPLLARLTPGSRVLDLGCGAGLPIAGALARAGHRVTGVDVSAQQIERARGWLRPGGHLLASVTHFREAAYTEEDFFGVRMYWSNWSLDDYRRMLGKLGFELLESRILSHGYDEQTTRKPESHPLLFARKSG